MTLKEFFDLLAGNPVYIITFFSFIPLTALIAGVLGRGEGHLAPWKYLYAALIYLVCVPGIFSITLSVYVFLFERKSVFTTDIYTQILPVVSMIATLLLIRKNVSLDRIPGFQKLSGLMMMIGAVLVFMWIIDRTRIFAFTYIPFQYVILIFIVLLLIIRFGWSSFMRSSDEK